MAHRQKRASGMAEDLLLLRSPMSHREAERRQRQRKETRPLTGLGPVFIKAGCKVWVASQVRGSTSEVQR